MSEPLEGIWLSSESVRKLGKYRSKLDEIIAYGLAQPLGCGIWILTFPRVSDDITGVFKYRGLRFRLKPKRSPTIRKLIIPQDVKVIIPYGTVKAKNLKRSFARRIRQLGLEGKVKPVIREHKLLLLRVG